MPSAHFDPRIAIIGAGIGGLVAALQLHAEGFTDINIFEASSSLKALGVGINVQPHAVLILRNLGLLPALEHTGLLPKELNYYNIHGDPILSEPRGFTAGYTVPQISIHRGHLQMLLFDTVKERLGTERLHLGHALSSFEESDQKGNVTSHFVRRRDANAPAEISSFTSDVLIAADGINSTVRKLFYPNEGPPRFSGRLLWRACTETDPFLTGASQIWAGQPNQKFIAYPISSSHASQSPPRSLTNWLAELRVRAEDDPDTTPPERPDWTIPADKARFAAAFKDWKFDWLDIPALIERADAVYEYPMCDRDPLPRWSFGRVTLLGDAAHPMLPIGSNGASQAILDAAAITTALLAHPTSSQVATALTSYETARLGPTSAIVLANRGLGPEVVMKLAHERAPQGWGPKAAGRKSDGGAANGVASALSESKEDVVEQKVFARIEDVISTEELEEVGKRYKAVAGFEVEAVNKRAKETEWLAEGRGFSAPAAWCGSIDPVGS